jgi:hypothetical protein
MVVDAAVALFRELASQLVHGPTLGSELKGTFDNPDH